MHCATRQLVRSPAKCAFFGCCMALPFLVFCVWSYLIFRPIEAGILLSLFIFGAGSIVWREKYQPSVIFQFHPESWRWAQCGCAGLLLGVFLVHFVRPIVEHLAAAPTQSLWLGIVFCLEWLLPFFLLMQAAVSSLLRFRKRTRRPMLSYTIVDMWAAIAGLMPVMLLANVRFDPDILLWIFLAQMLGIFSGKALIDTYYLQQRFYASPLSIMGGAIVGLAATCVPIQYLFTGKLIL